MQQNKTDGTIVLVHSYIYVILEIFEYRTEEDFKYAKKMED